MDNEQQDKIKPAT